MVGDAGLRIPKPDASVADLVVTAVQQAIAAGTLTPGQRLTEREMTESTGVSRTSVREALRHLQAQGLVQPAPGGGLKVAVLDRQAIEHIYEVRAAVEPAAIRLFTLRADDDAVLAHAALLDPRTPPPFDDQIMQRWLEADRLVLEVVGNPIFSGVMEPLYARIQQLRALSMSDPTRARSAGSEMQQVLAAVRNRDPRAAEDASRRHVEAARESALRVVAGRGPE